MVKLIRRENGIYDLDYNGRIYENLKKNFDGRKNCYDIKIPEEICDEIGRKYFSETRFPENLSEIDLGNIPSHQRNSSEKSEKSVRLNWEDFISNEDKEIFDEIKKRACENMRKRDLEIQILKYEEMIKNLKSQLG